MLCSSPRSIRLLPSSDLARFLRSRIMSATVMSAISRRMHKNSPAHTWTSQTPPMRGMVGGCTRRNGRTQCVHRAQSKHLKNPPRPRRREPLCTHKPRGGVRLGTPAQQAHACTSTAQMVTKWMKNTVKVKSRHFLARSTTTTSATALGCTALLAAREHQHPRACATGKRTRTQRLHMCTALQPSLTRT